MEDAKEKLSRVRAQSWVNIFGVGINGKCLKKLDKKQNLWESLVMDDN